MKALSNSERTTGCEDIDHTQTFDYNRIRDSLPPYELKASRHHKYRLHVQRRNDPTFHESGPRNSTRQQHSRSLTTIEPTENESYQR